MVFCNSIIYFEEFEEVTTSLKIYINPVIFFLKEKLKKNAAGITQNPHLPWMCVDAADVWN